MQNLPAAALAVREATDDGRVQKITEITVTSDDIKTVIFDGSVVIMTGTRASGQRVTFAGDLRPMTELIDVVMRTGEATAEAELWQILGRIAA